jgi:hypothetical protein
VWIVSIDLYWRRWNDERSTLEKKEVRKMDAKAGSVSGAVSDAVEQVDALGKQIDDALGISAARKRYATARSVITRVPVIGGYAAVALECFAASAVMATALYALYQFVALWTSAPAISFAELSLGSNYVHTFLFLSGTSMLARSLTGYNPLDSDK